MKKYLITGCAGFIGSNFVHYMLKKYPERVLDGAVNVALRGKVDDVIEIVLCKQALDQLLVADVALHEDVAGVKQENNLRIKI